MRNDIIKELFDDENNLSTEEKIDIINKLQQQLKIKLDKKLFDIEHQGFKDFLKMYNL